MDDWTAIIRELKGHGLSQKHIASVCGCGQTTISDLAKGQTKDPSYSVGESLKRLLAQERARAQAASGPNAPPPAPRTTAGQQLAPAGG